MIIRYVEKTVTVFEIDGELFYFRDSANLPELFDNTLHKMVVPNLDNWLQAKTDQRHSLRGLRDMSKAFSVGLSCGLSAENVRQLITQAVIESRRTIFQTDLTNDYARSYFIELIDPAKIEEIHVKSIVDNFDRLLKKGGRNRLYNYLCRFWQTCNFNMPSAAAIFEGFIRRLGRQPTTPNYPDTTDLDNELIERVCQTVFRSQSLYNINDEIVANVRRIQS